jgi:hypothetical protein
LAFDFLRIYDMLLNAMEAEIVKSSPLMVVGFDASWKDYLKFCEDYRSLPTQPRLYIIRLNSNTSVDLDNWLPRNKFPSLALPTIRSRFTSIEMQQYVERLMNQASHGLSPEDTSTNLYENLQDYLSHSEENHTLLEIQLNISETKFLKLKPYVERRMRGLSTLPYTFFDNYGSDGVTLELLKEKVLLLLNTISFCQVFGERGIKTGMLQDISRIGELCVFDVLRVDNDFMDLFQENEKAHFFQSRHVLIAREILGLLFL